MRHRDTTSSLLAKVVSQSPPKRTDHLLSGAVRSCTPYTAPPLKLQRLTPTESPRNSVSPGALADAEHAAGLNRIQAERARPRDDVVAVRAGVEPHLADALARELLDHLEAHVRRQDRKST